ncbi:MAG: T9SS type A sorting domain-containing protein, partial [Chitinophagales bacterium]
EDCGGQAPVAVSGNKSLWEKTDDDIGGKQDLQWKLYPNPAENFAFVEFSLEESESALLEVFDLQGNAVTRLFYNQVDAGIPYRLQLELENLVEGIYVVQLSTKSGVREVKKLVVM